MGRMMLNVLVLWAVAVTGSCSIGRPRWHGKLLSVADSLGFAQEDFECRPAGNDRDFGRLFGCVRAGPDSTAYTYVDTSGTLVLVAMQYELSAEEAFREFEKRTARLERSFGEGSTCERPPSSSWDVRNRHWLLESHHRALVLLLPDPDLRVEPALRTVARLGPPQCDDLYSVPLRR